jgi:hypothetical protein
MQAW